MYAFITSINGTLFAEYSNENGETILADLLDAGIQNNYEFGEAYDLDYEPSDMYELIDALEDARNR